MLKRIELRNFMSHAHTVIEPAAGLTVLVGPNNCGKSALVAALQILCHNDNSTYVMRHGERECSVEVETDDGHVVRWSRRSSPSYSIDGQPFDRLRTGGLPEQLHGALRLPKVEAGDDTSFDIHFGCQKTPIFLLDRPSAAAAKFFASSSDAIRLVEMQRRHREKHAERQRERARLDAASLQLNAELETLQPAVAIEHRLKSAEALYQELQSLAGALSHLEAETCRLEGQLTAVAYRDAEARVYGRLASPPVLAAVEIVATLIDHVAECEAERALAGARTNVYQRLSPPPVLDETVSLAVVAANLEEAQRTQAFVAAVHKALEALAIAPTFDATAQLEFLLRQLQATQADVAHEQQRLQALERLAVPAQPAETSSLDRLIGGLITAESEIRHHKTTCRAFANLQAVPSSVAVEPLDRLLLELRRQQAEIQELDRQQEAVQQERQAAATQIRELASTAVCPTCGAPRDADRMLSSADLLGGHNHGE